MKKKRRNVADEIISDLKEMTTALKSGAPLKEKYTVRNVGIVPGPSEYDSADIRKLRDRVGVSQTVFAQMLGISAALVRAWENGQREPAPIARRLLDLIRADPARWRTMVRAA